ncbi:MAG: tRNA (N(6)-L-threonylcarbamoyladenosine(37)-C(2))-methylthiotransferase MtaB [Acidobacteriota bacterium]|nr:MAG: tRNA (N(6)-L-threonylcarbamoyladenosine(37)-C(2))-methylthiotransferase MtaB [Acidobacteriota bacterium]
MSRKFYIATFGCRTNQADSAAIREDFLNSEFEEAGHHRDAEVIVVNSCTVTHRSDQQVRQLARRMRRDNPNARILITGCYAQRDPKRVSRIEGIDAVVGNTRKQELVTLSDPEQEASSQQVSGSPRIEHDNFEKKRAIDLQEVTIIGGKTRPFVKIQDGCDAKCTYCIIPAVRGPSRSVPPEQIIQQVERLIAGGFAEIVLTGIHIGTYGMHLTPRFPLDRLLEELCALPGLGQLRISSIEPMELSRRVIDLASTTDRIAPHFHICLQSGSDPILRQMLRPYNTGRFLGIVQEIREKIPQAGIGTDLIVGFPGETEADHEATLKLLEDAPFTYLHVFPYSDRSGTVASKMTDKVRSETIRRRADELRQLSDQLTERFQSRQLGKEIQFLTLTEKKKGFREALSGNYLKVRVAPSIPGNQLMKGMVTRREGEYLHVDEASSR